MSEESQLPIPHSFIELCLPRGRQSPVESRDRIAARHDLCEDMAQMLTEHARTTLFALGVTEDIVLDRVYQGLRAEGSGLSQAEARWVVLRLTELLGWAPPTIALSDGARD